MLARICFFTAIAVAAPLVLAVCEPVGDEPDPVTLPVVTHGAAVVPCTNDAGWEIEIDSFRVAVEDVELTVEGETHASLLERLGELAVPAARAHPGHYAGGEVTGELFGELLLDLIDGDGEALGEATLLPGDYHGVNLTFRAAGEADGLEADDPLLGRAAAIGGTAFRAGESVAFTAGIEIEPGTQMVGGPFDLAVDGGTDVTLGLAVYTVDPYEDDTLFDGLDFGALDEDGDGEVAIAPGGAAHNVLMKTLVRHDHWGIEIE